MPLTEAQWPTSNDLLRLLAHLRRSHSVSRTRSGRRKLRLFACACCRTMVWRMRVRAAYRRVVEAAEGFADGSINQEELATAQLHRTGLPKPTWSNAWFASVAMQATALDGPVEAARQAASNSLNAVRRDTRQVALNPGSAREDDSQRAWKHHQCSLLRDIFSNPFRPPSVDPAWLSWNSGTVKKLAQAVYENRSFDRMPILADALEEAGCTDPDILGHCRGPGEHVRGCWLVDLLLGR